MNNISENKNRSHSDSMLFDSLVTDINPSSSSNQYFESDQSECISIIPDSPTVSTKMLGYNFCTWISIPSSNRDKCKQNTDNSKFKSAPNKCLKLANVPPSSPKKSPKDYWLLRHSSTHRHSSVTDNGEVFTFDVDVKAFEPEIEIPRRKLTLMDNCPEGNEIRPADIGCEVKLNNEIQCLKHKKYLQNRYQRQFSSSMEIDDVFFETFDICDETRKRDSTNDCILYHKYFDTKIQQIDTNRTDDSTLKSDSQIKVLQNRSNKETFLSPVLGLITSSSGIVDNSGPNAISLEKFVLSSKVSVSHNNYDSKETCYELCKRDKESMITYDSLNISLKKSELHFEQCQKSFTDTLLDHIKSNSDLDTTENVSINEDFLCKMGTKCKNENSSQFTPIIKNDKFENSQLNFNPISNIQLSLPLSTKKSIFHQSLFPSDQLLCYSSAPDLLKDNSAYDGGRNHICHICDRTFSRSDMLSRHMRLHTGQRPYECRTCGQVFSRSDHLQTHLRTHTGEKPYRCSQCLYAAPRRDMVTRHMRVHARGKTRRGKSEANNGLPLSPFNSHIIIDEKYFARTRLSNNYHKQISQINMISLKKESTVPRQAAQSSIDDRGNSDIKIQTQYLKLSDQKEFGVTQILSVDNTHSECSRGSDDISEHPLPLDLSIPLQLNDYQPKSTQQLLVPYYDLKILNRKKDRKWSLADISSVKCVNIHDDRQISLSATCSPMTRSDSTMSVDSGVSYATPSSLIHSICSPGHISSDSPDIFTPCHEPTIFLWPSVDNQVS